MKEGTAALVTRRDKEFIALYNGSGCVSPVTGFPFDKGEGFSIGGIKEDEAVGFKNCDHGLAVWFENGGGAVGGTVGLTFPNYLSGFLIKGLGGPGFDDELIAQDEGGGGEAPFGWAFHAGFFKHVFFPDDFSIICTVSMKQTVLAD